MERLNVQNLLNTLDDLANEYNEYAAGGNSELLGIIYHSDGTITLKFYDSERRAGLLDSLAYLIMEVDTFHYEIGE